MTSPYKVRKLSELRPYEKNARTHSDGQILLIQDSIQRFGFTNPILIAEDGLILAGHGRYEAAKRLGLEKVPTVTVSGLTPQEIRAYILADNKLALDAGWSEGVLAEELRELAAAGFDVSTLGFDDLEVQHLVGELEDYIGGDFLLDGVARTNNNMSKLESKTGPVNLTMGELMVVIPAAVYKSVLSAVKKSTDKSASICRIFEAGIRELGKTL